ncbi:MAG TPA: hypothetical protein DCE41_09050 [Cytophagales bacterium]|nr:hypothetical protein [Cytophagales bacterium]HAA20426.1 hypothetical protein [Cytophagales bacterium]HAP58365.1 hypothetical protein [Cytophagales bacterium]
MKKMIQVVAALAVFALISAEASAQVLIRPPACSQSADRLDLGDPNVLSFSVSYHQSLTWYTNEVCGANAYAWILQDGQQVMTTGTQLSMQARDLVWLPPGGCDEFNGRMTFPNPWSDVGIYHTTITVRPQINQTWKTVSVSISGVQKCTEIGDDGFYDTDPGGFGGE